MSAEPILVCDVNAYGHAGLIMLGDDGVNRCTVCHEPADPTVDDGLAVIETRVSGDGVHPYVTPPPCEHVGVTQQVFYALVRNAMGQIIRRDCKIKLRCSGCGVPLKWLPASAHFSEVDGERGLVCSVEAMTDTEAADGWQAVGEG